MIDGIWFMILFFLLFLEVFWGGVLKDYVIIGVLFFGFFGMGKIFFVRVVVVESGVRMFVI